MSGDGLDALGFSVERLRHLTAPLTARELTAPAYPTEWTIADVLSHIGSGAVIMQRRIEDTLACATTPDDYAPNVWDAWNAKSPEAKRDDALTADRAFLARIDAMTASERASFAFAVGPLTFDFDGVVGLRLNEHAMHTWDIEVAVDPAAVIPSQIAALVVDNLDLIARFTAKPTGETETITVRTIVPARAFTVRLAPESATLDPDVGPGPADLELPSEAFARLVYGRLDPAHTPAGADNHAVDVLRRVFPGP